VLAVALTPETRHLIGKRELQMMKPTAYLINVARGEVADEEALIEALRAKTIAGAGLDVFSVEPLPPSSPLWDIPNVIVTPHSSAAIANYAAHSASAFAENLRRYLNGQPLLNIVDKKKGY
jgi:phosphoglycerate dehydrogenase-like enzyme